MLTHFYKAKQMKTPSAWLWYNPEISITLLIGLLDFLPRLILLHLGLHNIRRPPPLLRPLHLHCRLGMLCQEPGQGIYINPYLVIPFLLGLVKNLPKTPVQMHDLDIVHILRGAIPGVTHKATCQEQTKNMPFSTLVLLGPPHTPPPNQLFLF